MGILSTEEQRQMYAAEKVQNFRWISRLVATYSKRILTDSDFIPGNLFEELAELGQFAEIAYSAVPIAFLIENYATLNQPRFPLEHYDVLRHCILVDSFKGTFTELPAFIAFRPNTRQLVVSICGSLTAKHAVQDIRAWKTAHPSARGRVHTGFWALYQGLKEKLFAGIRTGIAEHSPTELILTGHSMGGCLSYLFCMDLLANNDDTLPPNLKLRVAVFGAPRSGDSDLVDYFRSLVIAFREKRGEENFSEYMVKGYNDGVPALPPAFIGYRHFCKEPIYTTGGKLYRTPADECEHALFHVRSNKESKDSVHLFPKGGHNYYNGRDQERFARRIRWLDKAKPMEEGWDERYINIVSRKGTYC